MTPDELAAYVEHVVDETEHAAEQAMPDGVLTRTPHEVFDECRAVRALLAWRERLGRVAREVGESDDPVPLARTELADEALAVLAREWFGNRPDWPA